MAVVMNYVIGDGKFLLFYQKSFCFMTFGAFRLLNLVSFSTIQQELMSMSSGGLYVFKRVLSSRSR